MSLFLSLYYAALATVFKELGLCLIRRHLQEFDPQDILGESQSFCLETVKTATMNN